MIYLVDFTLNYYDYHTFKVIIECSRVDDFSPNKQIIQTPRYSRVRLHGRPLPEAPPSGLCAGGGGDGDVRGVWAAWVQGVVEGVHQIPVNTWNTSCYW